MKDFERLHDLFLAKMLREYDEDRVQQHVDDFIKSMAETVGNGVFRAINVYTTQSNNLDLSDQYQLDAAVDLIVAERAVRFSKAIKGLLLSSELPDWVAVNIEGDAFQALEDRVDRLRSAAAGCAGTA